MLDKEPLYFPSRHRFAYDPGIPDKQLWAIGMIVVQWSMTEWFIDVSARQLIIGDDKARDEYAKRRNFQQRLDFWQVRVEQKTSEPWRSIALSYVSRVQALNSQRDDVVHRLWGGGMETNSPSSAGLETADAGMLPQPGEKFKSKSSDGLIPLKWNASFVRLRRMATEMATLNRDLLALAFLPGAPHGHVDRGGQIAS